MQYNIPADTVPEYWKTFIIRTRNHEEQKRAAGLGDTLTQSNSIVESNKNWSSYLVRDATDQNGTKEWLVAFAQQEAAVIFKLCWGVC